MFRKLSFTVKVKQSGNTKRCLSLPRRCNRQMQVNRGIYKTPVPSLFITHERKEKDGERKGERGEKEGERKRGFKGALKCLSNISFHNFCSIISLSHLGDPVNNLANQNVNQKYAIRGNCQTNHCSKASYLALWPQGLWEVPVYGVPTTCMPHTRNIPGPLRFIRVCPLLRVI